MESIAKFTQTLPFIIFFLVVVLILNMTTNNKVTNGFLTLTLLSMLVLNADKFKNMLGVINNEQGL